MRRKRLVAALAVAAAAATTFASPAVAQTAAEIDQAFLEGVREKGVPIRDDADALQLAHETCNLLNEGGTTTEALKFIKKAHNTWSDRQVMNFGGLAVYAYCKEHLPE